MTVAGATLFGLAGVAGGVLVAGAIGVDTARYNFRTHPHLRDEARASDVWLPTLVYSGLAVATLTALGAVLFSRGRAQQRADAQLDGE